MLVLNLKVIVSLQQIVQFLCSDNTSSIRGQRLAEDRKMSGCVRDKVGECAYNWSSAGLRLGHSAAPCHTPRPEPSTDLSTSASVGKMARQCYVSKSPAAHICTRSSYLWVVVDSVLMTELSFVWYDMISYSMWWHQCLLICLITDYWAA